MKRAKVILSVSLVFIMTLILVAGSFQVFPTPVSAHNGNSHLVKTFTGPDGKLIDELVFPVKPPTTKIKSVAEPQPNISLAINTVSGTVPAFDWSYGCSATSAAMLFGYYDLNGYSNMYTGSTNNGACPPDNSVWGHTQYPSVKCGECPLSASHMGIDGRSSLGHVDDYWVDYDNRSPDPYVRAWTPHTSDSVGDFMGTNQSYWGNSDGSTTFYFYNNGDPIYDYSGSEASGSRDGAHGMKLFAESRGYTVTTTFNQYIQGQGSDPTKGFTFADYVAEINAGHPVLIQVSGHTMLGWGYDLTNNTVYLHDTWDYADHTMTWGGSYSGMQHYGVTVFQLASTSPPTVSTMHIQSIDLSFTSKKVGKAISYQVAAKVKAADSSDVALSGATVYGSWSGPYAANVSGITDSNGNVSFLTPWVKKSGTYTFKVTRVVKSGYTYDASAGVTGNNITVR